LVTFLTTIKALADRGWCLLAGPYNDPWLALMKTAIAVLTIAGPPLAWWAAASRHYFLAWMALSLPIGLAIEAGKGLWRRFEVWQRRPRALDRKRLANLSDDELLKAVEIVRACPLSGPMDTRVMPHYSPELYQELDARFEELRLCGLLIRSDAPKERWLAGADAREVLDWERERRDLKLISFAPPGRASRPSGLAERRA
jgi:hypothetical protein